MIIRHGEKPGTPIDAPGIDPNTGDEDPHSLTSDGWKRARALVTLFNPHGPIRSGLAVPQHLFAANDSGGDASKRPIQTITPLAQSLGLEQHINASISAADIHTIAKAARETGDVVLICWKHENILEIARHICPEGLPAKWPGRRFDIVFVFDLDNDSYTFQQIPQLLLPDDSSTLFV